MLQIIDIQSDKATVKAMLKIVNFLKKI